MAKNSPNNADIMYYEKTFGKKPKHSRTIAVDFDGVINSYKTRVGLNRQNYLPDPPVEGALNWVLTTLTKFNIIIFTCRAVFPEGVVAVKEWLKKWGFPELEVTGEKPIAHLYVDDRGYQFQGDNFPSLEYMDTFKTWVRREHNG